MTYAKGMHPGAVWRRADFQIHTPRDPHWKGSAQIAGGTAELELARAQWADIFVAHCLKIGLDAIAVTDHHDACFVDYVSEAISRVVDGHRRLWFLPGMEITCRDAVQCLVLFDRGTSFDTMRRLFGGHLNIAEPDRNDAANPHAIECGKQIEEFITSASALDTTHCFTDER